MEIRSNEGNAWISYKGQINTIHQGILDSYLIEKFRIPVDTWFSSIKNPEDGVPQGSILSLILFNLKINNLTKELPPRIDGSLYVDDFMICCNSKYIHKIERKLQLGIRKSADGQQ